MNTDAEILERARDALNVRNAADGERLLLPLVLRVLLDIRRCVDRIPAGA